MTLGKTAFGKMAFGKVAFGKVGGHEKCGVM